MASRIDAFYKRLEKTNKIKGKGAIKDFTGVKILDAKQEDANIPSVTHAEVFVRTETDVESEAFLREKGLQASIDGIVGKLLIKEPDVKKNDGFIFDIMSNAVSFEADTQSTSDFILNDHELFVVNPCSIVDMAMDTVVNMRTAYLRNDLKFAASLVSKILSDMVGNGERFYLLPDNTDFFIQNIKSAFTGGYRFIWRSIIAAYVRYEKNSGTENISVIDLFENEPARVDVKVEQSKKFRTHIFTRSNKTLVKELKPLSYWAIAIAFWKEYGNKIRVSLDANRLALTDDTFRLLCNGKSFTLLYSGKLYKIEAQFARDFLIDYFGKYNKELSKLKGCIVFADHLRNAGIKGNFEYIESDEVGRCLVELKRRVKNSIPLWQETLPKLALQRIAVNGRLGEYILVDDEKRIPNTFGVFPVPCEEMLMLPAGHKIIKFPLTISGINNKNFIAKVELEEELTHETEFDVMLKYDFNNENSYYFELTRGDKKYALIIEEGMPEKRNLPFEMKIEDNRDIMEDIYHELSNLLNCVKERNAENFYRAFYENGDPKERRWEYNSRVICNKIASLILGLSYSTREGKYFSEFELNLREIRQQMAYRSNEGDNIDKCYIGLVHATIALFTDDYAFTDPFYNAFQEWRKGHRFLEYAVESKILCNSTFDTKTIDGILDACKGESIIRTFSLPLLANDALLNYICSNKCDWLNKATKALIRYFNDINESLKNADANKLINYVRRIRDGYEFTLGLLKLRGTKYWGTVRNIEKILEHAIEIERSLYSILSHNTSQTSQITKFIDIYKAQDWHDKNNNSIGDYELLLSRITFGDNEVFQNLRLMHPLALTAITYLEGNPDIHIIGCGLKDEVD